MADDSFFGKESVAWRVHADPAGLVGGIRSLAVQALEPRAMAAVAGHGAFRDDFWGRLRRTSDFLSTVIFGTRTEAEAAAAVVRAVHARIRGLDEFTGHPYRADEPELLTWVHNATVESYLTANQLYGKRLGGVECDRYIAEMRVLGVLMGLDQATLPADARALRAY